MGKIHHFQWVNPLIGFDWAIFNSKLLVYQRVCGSTSVAKLANIHPLW